MELFIKIVRWTFSFILAVLFGILLLLSIIVSSLALTVADRNTPKSILVESGIYSNAEPLLRNIILNRTEPGSEMEEMVMRLDDPDDQFAQLVNEKLSPSFLQNTSETVIDAFYDWFEGETDVPTFEIKIADSKQEIIKIANIGFQERMSNLPVCEPDFVAPDDFNPLSAECLPQEYDLDQVGVFLEENSETPEFLKFTENFTISSDFIKFPPGVGSEVQFVYSIIDYTPYILLGVMTLLAIILAAVIPGAIRGVKMVSISIVIYSLMLLAVSFFALNYVDDLFDIAYGFIIIPPDQIITETIENVVFVVLDSIFENMKIVSGVALAYGVVFGGIGYFIAKWLENRGKEKIGTKGLS